MNKSKLKGTNFERDIVKLFNSYGFKTKRAYASVGDSLGEHAEVDLKVFNIKKISPRDLESLTFQVKRPSRYFKTKENAAFHKRLGFSDFANGLIFKEDNQPAFIVFQLDTFIKDFL